MAVAVGGKKWHVCDSLCRRVKSSPEDKMLVAESEKQAAYTAELLSQCEEHMTEEEKPRRRSKTLFLSKRGESESDRMCYHLSVSPS